MTTFPSTHWSMIEDLAGDSDGQRLESIERFLRTYSRPMQAFLAWQFRQFSPVDREDFLQAFIASRVLASDLYRHAIDGDVVFRSYLKTTLRNFVIDEIRRLDRYRHLLQRVEHTTPPTRTVDPLDFEWARNVIVQAMVRFRQACIDSERMIVWDVFDLRVRRPAYYGQDAVGYDVLSKKLGRTEAELRNLLVTAKRMMRRQLYDVVGGYVVGDEAIEEEIRDLQRIAAQGNFLSVGDSLTIVDA